MTKITIFIQQGSYRGFICKDHCGYAEEGRDIVCAAVSVLAINTINSITELTGNEMDVQADEENAEIKAFFRYEPTEDAELLIRSFILGITAIAEDPETAEFVDLIFEEE